MRGACPRSGERESRSCSEALRQGVEGSFWHAALQQPTCRHALRARAMYDEFIIDASKHRALQSVHAWDLMEHVLQRTSGITVHAIRPRLATQ